ncbi:MAG: hypothetical protein L0221_19160, partial [Chloroflexi bacterium]|nr:hypothetical protein [Chloroflexota bacterium]
MEVRDPLGRRVQTGYDDGGNPVETRRLDEFGCLLAYSTTTYDLRGLPSEVIDYLWEYEPPHTPCAQLPPAVRGLVTRLIHDGTGKLTGVIDPLDRQTTLLYDAAERLSQVTDPAGNVTAYTLDAAGNRVAEEVTEQLPGGGSETVEIAHVYDALNRRIATRDGLANEWRSILDARGNLRVSIDPEGHVTERAYDGLDRLTSLTRPGGLRVELGYDAASRPVVYRDALGNETAWTYDDAGRVTGVAFEDGTSESWAYDAAGNPTRHTDGRGNVIDQSFDLLGRLTGRQVTAAPGVLGPTAEAYEYDALGRLVRAESGAQVVERSYDSLSRPLGETIVGRALARAFDDLEEERRAVLDGPREDL